MTTSISEPSLKTEDLEAILQFMEDFDSPSVTIKDSGPMLTASLYGVQVNGHSVYVTKIID